MPSGRKLIAEAVERGETGFADLSRAAGKNHAYIQQFVKREVPAELPEAVRVALAPVLNCSPDDLRESDPPVVTPARPPHEVRPAPEVHIPAGATMPRDLPVYGTAAGSNGDGAFLLSQQDVVDYVRRPPGLSANKGAYGVYVEGESMEPAYLQGALIIVDPARKPRPGDGVVIVCAIGDSEADGQTAFVKEFVKQSTTHLTVKQFNPPREIVFERAKLASVHRILTTAELMGAA